MKFSALIVAAGEGKRLGRSTPKAFVELQSKPLYQYSLEIFQRHPGFDEIVLVVPTQEKFSIPGVKIVEGGLQRQDSVWNGLQAVDSECEGVLVHDAARPFLTLAIIDRLLEQLKKGCNAIPAISVSDTIKSVEGDRILKTVDRSRLMCAQTPQACLMNDLKTAFQKSKKESWNVTDEANLLERAGFPVFVIEGDPMNIKITTKEDLELASAILEKKK